MTEKTLEDWLGSITAERLNDFREIAFNQFAAHMQGGSKVAIGTDSFGKFVVKTITGSSEASFYYPVADTAITAYRNAIRRLSGSSIEMHMYSTDCLHFGKPSKKMKLLN